MKSQRVVIVGASDRPDRYAHKAMKALLEQGHEVVLVNPRVKEIDGLPVLPNLADASGRIDTVTMYVGPLVSAIMLESLIALMPERVIFNPGTESPELESKLKSAGINTKQACTLALLATNQF